MTTLSSPTLLVPSPVMESVITSSEIASANQHELPKTLYSYFLPKSSEPEEKSRLSIQHYSVTLALGGLYPAESRPFVLAALANDGPQGKRKILDVGSGNGAWAMDMAREFPHATVIGFDLSPAKPDNLPSNCSFAYGDFSDWNNVAVIKNQKFDIIHSRFTRAVVRDTAKDYDDMSRSLAPGGILLVGDGCSYLTIKQKGEYVVLPRANPGDPTIPRLNIGPNLFPVRSWFARFMYDFLDNAARERGFPLPMPDAYIPYLIDNAKKSGGDAAGGYEWSTIGRRQYYMPIGWDGDEGDVKLGLGKEVGEAVRQTALLLVRTWRDVSIPGFIAIGVDEKTVDEWVSRAIEEIKDPAFRMYLYMDYTWAVRTN